MAMTPEEEELEKFIAAMNDVQSTEKVAEGLKTKSPEQMLQEYEATMDKTISQSPEAPGIGTKALSLVQGLTGGILPAAAGALRTMPPIGPSGEVVYDDEYRQRKLLDEYTATRDAVAAPLEEAARLEPGYETGGQIASMALPLGLGIAKGGPLLVAGIKEAKQLGTLGQYGINAAKQVLKVAPVLAAGGAVESVISAPVTPGTLTTPEQAIPMAIEGGKTALEMAPLTLLLGPAAKKYNFRETPSITRFKVEAPPAPLSPAKADLTRFNIDYPEAPDRVAELAAEIKQLNSALVQALRAGDNKTANAIREQLAPLKAEDKILRPEIDTEAERIAKLESNKNAAFTKEGFRAAMTDEELEAAAVAKAATAKKPKFILPERSVAPYRAEANRRLYPSTKPNKNKGNVPDEETTQFEGIDVGAEEKAIETAVKASHAARKKTQSREYFSNRRFYGNDIDDVEVKDILKDPNHPLLTEPVKAAASADKGYQLAMREWQPNKNLDWRTGEPDYVRTGEQIILMNNDLAPVQRSKLAFREKPDPKALGNMFPSQEKAVEKIEDLWRPVNDRVVASKLANPKVTWERQDTFGQGVYGRVYPVVDRNGKPKAAKISFVDAMNRSMAAETHAHEKEVARAIQNVRANATPTEKSLYLKHFPDFEQIIDRPDNPDGYIIVMQELRPMNDIEKAELFEGRKILKDRLEKQGYKNVDAYMDTSGPDFILPTDSDFSGHPDPATMANLPWKDKYRRVLSPNDYKNMTPRVRSAYKALEYMSGEKGIGWGDLHSLGNALIDPKTGAYVFQDVGLFQLKNASNPMHRYNQSRNYDQRVAAELAGAEARIGDAEALAADIAENEARAPRPLADKATVERARAAGKAIKTLPPDEMARRFKQPNRSAGAMAAEPGFYEDANGQMVFWSGQQMLSTKPKTSVSAALERLNPTDISTGRAAEPEQMEFDFAPIKPGSREEAARSAKLALYQLEKAKTQDLLQSKAEQEYESQFKGEPDKAYKDTLARFLPRTSTDKKFGEALIKAGLAPLDRTKLLNPVKSKIYYKDDPDNDFLLSPEIGKGSFGRAYSVIDQNGNQKIAKISDVANPTEYNIQSALHEKRVAQAIQQLQRDATPEEKKYLRHFPTFEAILPNPLEPKNGFIFVMDELRDLNDYEFALLFKGKSAVEQALNVKGWTGMRPDFDFPTGYRFRKALTPDDYADMPPNVRRFYEALEWLADEKDIKWDDLHKEGNVMVDPKTNELVALDIGQFTLRGELPPGNTTSDQGFAGTSGNLRRLAEQAVQAESAIAGYRARNPQGMVRIPFFGNKSKPQKELPSAGSTTGGTAMIPVGSKDIVKRAKGPGVIERAEKALRTAKDKLNLQEFRDERNILDSEYNFYNAKLAKATTEREIRAAERELSNVAMKRATFSTKYPDIQDFDVAVKAANKSQKAMDWRREMLGSAADGESPGALLLRADEESLRDRKSRLINKMVDTFRKYPQMLEKELTDDHPVKVAWDTW